MNDKLSIPFGRPLIGDEDRRAVLQVLRGHILTHGANCAAFEREFAAMMRGGYCITTSSCMAALHLSALHIGLGPGDEAIVPAMTHVATAHAVEITGAKPVFVDCEPTTGNPDIAAIEAAVTDRTKAIFVVHFAGIPLNMTRLVKFAKKRDLPIVEDCALAVGARWDGQHVGLFGHTGCFSFYPVKHITTGEGGMLASQHADVAGEMARFRAFNVDRTHAERSIPGVYDVAGPGLNYRMSELQAALGRGQLAKIQEFLDQRAANFQKLKSGLGKVKGVRVLDATSQRAESAHYCAVVVLEGDLGERRDEVVLRLNERGVGTSVYYPHPVPRLHHYREKYGYKPEDFPNAAEISDRSVSLPVGPHLDGDDMAAIATAFADIAAELDGG